MLKLREGKMKQQKKKGGGLVHKIKRTFRVIYNMFAIIIACCVVIVTIPFKLKDIIENTI